MKILLVFESFEKLFYNKFGFILTKVNSEMFQDYKILTIFYSHVS